jgi:hypothetical protein
MEALLLPTTLVKRTHFLGKHFADHHAVARPGWWTGWRIYGSQAAVLSLKNF